jgi:FAD/FMN-containing dehydrogenase
VSDLARAIQSKADGAYVGFLSDDGASRIHAAYPGSTWERLASVKAKYDPANLFRLNQNIAPASNAA